MSRRDNRCGQASMVSMALYSAIVVVGISTVVLVGTPILEDMRDAQVVDAAKDTLTGMEEQIRSVANAGEGSSTTVGLRFSRGDLIIDAGTDTIRYELETGAEIIGAHTSQQIGNLRVSSMADVSVTESAVNGQPCWKLENEHVSACIRQVPVNASALIGPDTAGYWRFNANSGGTTYDNASYRNHGTIVDSTWTDGMQGSALQFDGENDYVTVDDAGALDVTGDMTLAAWVRLRGRNDMNNWQGIVSKGGSSSAYDLYWNQTGYEFRIDGNRYPLGDENMGRWAHLVITLNGSTLRFYQDGTLVRTQTAETLDTTNTGDLYIGRNGWNSNDLWNGTIDEVRIWNRSLTADETRWLHEQHGMLDYIDTEDLVLRYYNKDQEEVLDADFGVSLGEDGSDVAFTNNGTGHVTPQLTGHHLGRGQVDARIKSFFGVDYTVTFQLPSGADFMQVNVDE